MSKFFCTFVTPTRGMFIDQIAYAEVPGSEGMFGVKAGHAMQLATLKKGGVLTLWMDEACNDKREFVLYEGCAFMDGRRLSVLGRFAIDKSTIDTDVLKTKIENIKAEIAELEAQDTDMARAQLETHYDHLGFYESQVRIARGELF